MTNQTGAGASRRGRRRTPELAALVILASALFLVIKRSNAHDEGDAWETPQHFARSDAVIATHLLQSVAGANPVMCAAVERAFQTGSWGMQVLPADGATAEEDETARWIGRDHLERGALEPARQALASADACTRRVAAHIAGNVAVPDLERELDAELSSAVTATQVAAIMALGYSEQRSAAPRLRRMANASDRSVRLAAIWALGSIEDEGSSGVLINLLRNDSDADVRRLAAWALGHMN